MSPRLVVRRSPERDQVAWEDDGAPSTSSHPFRDKGEAPPEDPNRDIGPMRGGQPPYALIGIFGACLALGFVLIPFMPKPPKALEQPLVPTTFDLSSVHVGVTLDGVSVRSLVRGHEGSKIATEKHGRARLRLDSGSTVIVDGDAAFSVTADGLRHDKGRLFVTMENRTAVETEGVTIVGSGGATLALEQTSSGEVKAYVGSGEVVVRADREEALKVGETATIKGKTVKIAPEKGFDDWTGGMAAPWSASARPRRSIGEMWGRTEPGNPGAPMTIRSQEVRATVNGELAETEVKTTFFNGGSFPVTGDYRLAIPASAIVSGVKIARGDSVTTARFALASRMPSVAFDPSVLATRGDVVEWAGEGLLRGTFANIASGLTFTVSVSYVEWLSPRKTGTDKQVVTYRFPLVGESAPPLIGEFFARVDTAPSQTTALAAGLGARATGQSVELRRSDFRPTADFVVDVEMPRFAEGVRAYVAETGEDTTVLFRTDVPPAPTDTKPGQGIDIAVVIDSSSSIDPAMLDVARSFVDALVTGLGPADRIAVLSADQSTRFVGPDSFGPVDDARKKAILDGLGAMTVGGATDLGKALETAADLLPANAPSALVLYVGDGQASIGDLTPGATLLRLARRERGIPRLGAVLVGPSTNRLGMAALTRHTGPVLEVDDSADAARAAVTLSELALVPSVTDVKLTLGPELERVYPRDGMTAPRGGTTMVAAKLRGPLPKTLRFTYVDSEGRHEETRPVVVLDAARGDDVRRRWAELRVESFALAAAGREAAAAAAFSAGLLSPWTGFMTNAGEYVSTNFEMRMLESMLGQSAFVGADLLSRATRTSILAVGEAQDGTLEQTIVSAAMRTLEDARPEMRACRDSRAALRPDLAGTENIRFKLDATGATKDIAVSGLGDEGLDRCIETVVRGLPFAELGERVTVDVEYQVVFPQLDRPLTARGCSPTSTLPLALRRGIFRERIGSLGAKEAYLGAKRGCELDTWTARRMMLELALSTMGTADGNDFAAPRGLGPQALELARELDNVGEREAASFLRKEAIRRAHPDDLLAVRATLLRLERLPLEVFTKAYEAKTTDAERLSIVERFLKAAPHDGRLRRLELQLLGAMGRNDELAARVRTLRADPLATASVLADAAALLRAASMEEEARRTFGEIVERSPSDPWARALIGDRLRAEGWFDEAVEMYAVLDTLVPSDPITMVRMALAHAGAKRLDVAFRLLSRATERGGRVATNQGSLLALRTARVLYLSSLLSDLPEEDKKGLTATARDLPKLDAPFVLARGGGAFDLVAYRGPEKAREVVPPDVVLRNIGVMSLGLGGGAESDPVDFSISRPKSFAPDRPFKVSLDIVEGDKLTTREIEVPRSGEPVKLRWSGGQLTTP